MIHHRKFVNAILNDSSITYCQAKLCWENPFVLQCATSTFTKAKQSIFLVQNNDNKSNYRNLAAYINQFKKMNPDLIVLYSLITRKNLLSFHRLSSSHRVSWQKLHIPFCKPMVFILRQMNMTVSVSCFAPKLDLEQT